MQPRHQLGGFRCRSEGKTVWLMQMGNQAQGSGTTRVFVVSESEQPTVVAYDGWCMASVGDKRLTEQLRRGAGFDEHLIPEFDRSPTDPLTLLLLFKNIRRTHRR